MGLVEQGGHALLVNLDTPAHATTPFPVQAPNGCVKQMTVILGPAQVHAAENPMMAVSATMPVSSMVIAVQTTRKFAWAVQPVEKKVDRKAARKAARKGKREPLVDARTDSHMKGAAKAIPSHGAKEIPSKPLPAKRVAESGTQPRAFMTASRTGRLKRLPTLPEPSPSTALILVKKADLVEKKVDLAEKKVDLVEKKAVTRIAVSATVEGRLLEIVSAMPPARDTEIAAVTTNPYASARKVDQVERKELLEEKREAPMGALRTSHFRGAVKEQL